MKLLDDYLDLQKQLYEYFEYEPGWAVIPFDDNRDYYWYIHDDSADEVHFAESKENLKKLAANDFDYDIPEIDSSDYYSDEVYKVYRGEDYTMIHVDTHTDGNKFLAIFDNKKRVLG